MTQTMRGVNAHVERLPTGAQRPVRELARMLSDLFGPTLLGLNVYGPAVVGAVDRDSCGIESVMVLERVELSALRRLGEHGVKLGGLGLAAPLAMTPSYIKASLDSFPLELLEIAHRNILVSGTDYFGGLAFRDEHVRLQCEREFKRIALRIRQGLLTAAGRTDVLALMQSDLQRHAMRALRGFVWLGGERSALGDSEILSRAGQRAGRPLNGVQAIFDLAAHHPAELLDRLHEDMEALAGISDGA